MINKLLIPIFPLSGIIFFPDTDLPLNIFEKRYLEMIDFALSKNKTIGMIQTQQNGNFYNKGCLGKITSFNETNDGRYLINMRGESIFSFINEIESNNHFRMGEVVLEENNKNKILAN